MRCVHQPRLRVQATNPNGFMQILQVLPSPISDLEEKWKSEKAIRRGEQLNGKTLIP